MSTSIERVSHDPASILQCEPLKQAFSIASGAVLILPVLKKRSALRWTAAAAGGAMIYYAVNKRLATNYPAGSTHSLATKQTFRESITIDKSAAELFSLWLNHDVVSKVMYPYGYMTSLGPDHVRSTIELPVGKLELEALLVEARPNELVHWRTVSDSMLQVDERMQFSPAPEGTGTVATLNYEVDFSKVPAGEVLRAISGFFKRAPQSMLRRVMENFKSIAETGEISR